MAMEGVGDIHHDLMEARTLVLAQVEAGLPEDTILESLFVDFSKRIGALTCSFREKSFLTKAINDGPWTAEQRLALASNCLKADAGEGIDGARRRKNQTCMKFENMLAQQDWVAVRKATTRYGRVAVLGTRAYLINMDNPSEPTLHHWPRSLP